MRIGVVVLVLWTLANLVFSYRLGTTSRSPAAPADGRTALRVPVAAPEAVLTEMRAMLASVQGVTDGVARSDAEAIRRAAAASGMATAADPALEKVLPEEFLRLGMATHMAFDSLAANAAAGPEASMKALAGITSTCVACHAAFRLEAR